jgi:thymidine kinase
MRFLDGKPVFEGDSVLIDGTSEITYESVCGKCYLEKSGKIKARGRI